MIPISNLSIGEAQGLISSLIGPFYRGFFYKYRAIFQANTDHINIALEDLEKEVDSITAELLGDYKTKFHIDNDNIDKALLLVTNEGFADKISGAEIIGPMINIYLFQNKEFLKIKVRMERSINAFLKAYKEGYFQYEKGLPNGVLLVNYSQRIRQKSPRAQKERTGYIRATQGSLEGRGSISYIFLLYIGIGSQWIFTLQEFANFQKTRNTQFRICELSGRRQ